MKKEIADCLIQYANRVAETVQYNCWTDEFCRSEIHQATMDFLSKLRKHIDILKLTKEEALALHFGKWEKDGDLYLIPLYLLPIIPVGIELTCINGQTIIYNGFNVDRDTRCGCIAWGIHIPE